MQILNLAAASQALKVEIGNAVFGRCVQLNEGGGQTMAILAIASN